MLAIEFVVALIPVFSAVLTGLADDTLLTAAEHLECVATVQVDGGIAPYCCLLTIAATEDVQGLAEHVHTLLAQDDARVALGNQVIVVGVVDGFAQGVFLHHVEQLFTLHDGGVQVDDDIALHDAAAVAAAVDVAALETAFQVLVAARHRGFRCRAARCDGRYIFSINHGVPLQVFVGIGGCVLIIRLPPALGLNLQARQVELQAVASTGVGCADDAALVTGVKFRH